MSADRKLDELREALRRAKGNLKELADRRRRLSDDYEETILKLHAAEHDVSAARKALNDYAEETTTP